MIEILSLGSGISLQDGGRAGWRRYGMPAGGAMDTMGMAQANRLLGNPSDACVLEIALLGSQFHVIEDTWVALAGADFCSRIHANTAVPLQAGTVFSFDQKNAGIYAYLAMPGGIQSDRWLGSASADPRNGLGRLLSKGDCLQREQTQPQVSIQGVARRVATDATPYISAGSAHFKVYRGPQFEAFCQASQKQFTEMKWRVDSRSDRTGFRLEGAALKVPESMSSEPILPGSIQVPGNGKPIITMPDGPTVGGYPKIAILPKDDLPMMAQCAPGTALTFSWID